MVRLDIPHVQTQPNGSLKYRRIVPPQSRPAIGRKNWTRTWKRGTSLDLVRIEADALAQEHDRELAIARGEVLTPRAIVWAEEIAAECLADPEKKYQLLALWHVPARGDLGVAEVAAVNAIEHGGTYRAPIMVLTAALEQDHARYSDQRQPGPLNTAVAYFVASQGDLNISAITRDNVAAWKADLARDGLKPGTINRRLAAIRAMIARAFLDLEHDGRNPFDRQKVKDTVAAIDKRQPMTAEHLAALDSYLATSNSVDLDAKNCLNIIRNTGAGPAEVAGLKVSDVILDAPIPHIHIRDNGARSLKNAARSRKIPLIGVALFAAQNAAQAATGPNLFNSLHNGPRAVDLIGRKMVEAIRAAGIADRSTYSLRHNLAESMRVSGAREDLQRRLLGHAATSTKDRNYGASEATLSDMLAAITSALPHMGHFGADDC